MKSFIQYSQPQTCLLTVQSCKQAVTRKGTKVGDDCIAGADVGTVDADGAAPGKALPPWLLRQDISSTSGASGGQSRNPLTQAGVAASASLGTSAPTSEAIASEEEEQKRIEVSHHCSVLVPYAI